MVVLQCSRCGHEIEVTESVRNAGIRCARCGTPLSAKASTQAPIKPSEPSDPFGAPPAEPPCAAAEVATSHVRDEDTLAPRPASAAQSFPFLSPPTGPNELGWLAHYRVLRLLGQGGMGIVFEAVDSQLQRSVALKVMKPEYALDALARQRFLREARAMAAVKSDHIVTIHHVGLADNLPFLAMEFLQGESLDDWLKARGRPNLDEILRLGIAIARGLAAAHERGLIHRDIKPANIFLEGTDADSIVAVSTPSSNDVETDLSSKNTVIRSRSQILGLRPDLRIKILDFGLARLTRERSNLTDPGLVMGTPGYMSPEQVEGREVDLRTDLFSLGCLLYELSTGEPPFPGASAMAILMAVLSKEPKPPLELNPEMPPGLAELILSMLQKDPAQRPASAHEVAAALQKIKDTPRLQPLPPPEITLPRPAPLWRGWILIALLAIMSLLILGVSWWAGLQSR